MRPFPRRAAGNVVHSLREWTTWALMTHSHPFSRLATWRIESPTLTPHRHRNHALNCEQERAMQDFVSLHIRAHQVSGTGAGRTSGSS